MSIDTEWDSLNDAQRDAVNNWRQQIGERIRAAAMEFEYLHPELRISYTFQADVSANAK